MPRLENGFVYLWALFAVALAGIVMAGTGQVWQVKSQREKETELLYVGEQFRKAVMSYYNDSPGGAKQYPDSLEDLLQDGRAPNIKRHLRKIYLDPITNTTEWGIVEEPAAGQSSAPKSNQASSSSQTSSTSGQASISNQASNTGGQVSNTSQASNSSAPNKSSGISSNIDKRIIGVYSLSEKKPIKKDQFPEHLAKFSEALTYQDWQFVYKPGDTSKPPAPTSTQSKPNATSAPSPTASPFSSSQSSSNTNSKAPSPGFPSAK